MSLLDKTEHQLSVEQFMLKAGEAIPDSPQAPDAFRRLQRAKLLLEETLELIEALGVKIYVTPGNNAIEIDINPNTFGSCLTIKTINKELDLAEIAKEVADVIVIASGTASACGIGMSKIQATVDANNIGKFDGGGYRDDSGKWRKPPNYQKPDLVPHLEEQGFKKPLE